MNEAPSDFAAGLSRGIPDALSIDTSCKPPFLLAGNKARLEEDKST